MGRCLGKWQVTQRQGCRWRQWWPSRRLHRSQLPTLRSGRRKVFFCQRTRGCHLDLLGDWLGHHLTEKVVALLHLYVKLCHALLWQNIVSKYILYFLFLFLPCSPVCARTLFLNIFCIFYSCSFSCLHQLVFLNIFKYISIYFVFSILVLFLPPSTWSSRFPTRARPSTRRTAGCKKRGLGSDSLAH